MQFNVSTDNISDMPYNGEFIEEDANGNLLQPDLSFNSMVFNTGVFYVY